MAHREIVYKAHKFQVAQEIIALRDGSETLREAVVHPGAVVIVPWVDEGHICLIRNYRWPVKRALLELPAGTLLPGEDPEQTARRELAEETGYRAGRLTKLIEFYPSPGILTELMHLYSAEDLTPGPTAPEPDEQIISEVVTWEDALKRIDSGQIVDAKTLAGLLFLERRRQQSGG